MDVKKTCHLEDNSLAYRVVVRARVLDCHAGMKGRDYITARNIGKLLQQSIQEHSKDFRE
ncbi:hypothetical protein [Pseudoduganella sp. HUAS MS19]